MRHPEIFFKLKADGIYVIPDFISPEVCAELRHEIDRLILKYEKSIWVDALRSDCRIFGAEEVSEGFDRYFKNEFIRSIVLEFERGAEIKGFVMAARLDYKPGNQGSGNGWHRDSVHYTQTKSILYLSDVGENSGPFEYIRGSQSPKAFIRGWLKKLDRMDKFRFSDEEVAGYLLDFPELKAETFPAKQGSLILADTRGLHRGRPIQNGSRYSATNYFFVNTEPPAHLSKIRVLSGAK